METNMAAEKYKKRLAEAELEIHILKQELKKSEGKRKKAEKTLKNHSSGIKKRNAELEQSQSMLIKSVVKYQKMAHYDSLTGLPNRTFLCEHIKKIKKAKHEYYGAFLFLDLDQFKGINDNYGHEAGDFVLYKTAERILGCVRGKDIVIRVGGDEFVILMPGLCKSTALTAVAERIIQEVSKPYEFKGIMLSLGVSIGISIYPDDDSDPEKLIQKADKAMYHIKKRGGRGCQCYKNSK